MLEIPKKNSALEPTRWSSKLSSLFLNFNERLEGEETLSHKIEGACSKQLIRVVINSVAL